MAPISTETSSKFLQQIQNGKFGVALTDIWRKKHPEIVGYTHRSTVTNGPSRARIDYFLVCSNTSLFTKEAWHDDSEINGMHHKGINLSIAIPITRQLSKKYKRDTPNWDDSLQNSENFIKAANGLAETKIVKSLAQLQRTDAPFNNPSQEELDDLTKQFETSLKNQLKSNISKKSSARPLQMFADEENELNEDNNMLNNHEKIYNTEKRIETLEEIKTLLRKYDIPKDAPPKDQETTQETQPEDQPYPVGNMPVPPGDDVEEERGSPSKIIPPQTDQEPPPEDEDNEPGNLIRKLRGKINRRYRILKNKRVKSFNERNEKAYGKERKT